MTESEKLLSQKRRKYILDLVNRDAGATTTQLAKELKVSLSTIGRDLRSLEKNGLVLKTHGGAVPRSFSTSYEPAYALKAQLYKKKKELIGKVSSSLIRPGDTVIFDSGTTVFQVAHCSVEKKFSAITLDLPAAMKLANSPSIDLVVLGGNVRAGVYAIIGNFAEEMLRKLYVDKFFMGADAIDLKKGITNATLAEVAIKQLAIEVAKEVILVADSSKFDNISLIQVCELQKISKIITDISLPSSISLQLEKIGIEIIIAHENKGANVCG